MSIGHTDARASDIVAAADAGASAVTHLFNAMRGLDSREPGTVGAALLDDRLQLGMIADGKHVSPTTMQIALRAKGHNGMFLVSDAVSPTGTTQTSFTLYGIDVEVRDGGCYTPEGVLAGSATPLHGGVAVLCRDAQQPVERAIAMATRHPARVIGLEGCKGGLFEGAHADIVVLDEALRPTDVIVRGEPLATLAPLA